LRRLASLSALGAGGALGLTAATIDASGIVYSGMVDEKVGYGSAYGTQATIAGPNGAAGNIFKYSYNSCTSYCFRFHLVNLGARSGAHGTTFRFLNSGSSGPVKAFPRGAVFGMPASSFGFGKIAESYTNSGITGKPTTRFNSTDRFLLFRFTGGKLPHAIYGWAHLKVTLPGNFVGPDVTLVSYAYDLTGAQIPAGYRGKALDGDEAEYERSGLSALSLGAAGVRSWRAARQADAQGAAGATPAH